MNGSFQVQTRSRRVGLWRGCQQGNCPQPIRRFVVTLYSFKSCRSFRQTQPRGQIMDHVVILFQGSCLRTTPLIVSSCRCIIAALFVLSEARRGPAGTQVDRNNRQPDRDIVMYLVIKASNKLAAEEPKGESRSVLLPPQGDRPTTYRLFSGKTRRRNAPQ